MRDLLSVARRAEWDLCASRRGHQQVVRTFIPASGRIYLDPSRSVTEDQRTHRPFAVAHDVAWPCEIAVFRSPSSDFELLAMDLPRFHSGQVLMSGGPLLEDHG